MEILINADDFGMSRNSTDTILDFFKKDLIDRTSLMMNMPYTQNAIDSIHKLHLERKIGLHLNLTEGQPLSDNIRKCGIFCDSNGMFDKRYKKTVINRLMLRGNEKRDVTIELQCQINKYINSGLSNLHADSHQGILGEISISKIAFDLLSRNHFSSIRFGKSVNISNKLHTRVISFIDNARYKKTSLQSSDYFADMEGLKRILECPGKYTNAVIEVMVHPLVKEDILWIDYWSGYRYDDYIDLLMRSREYKPCNSKRR